MMPFLFGAPPAIGGQDSEMGTRAEIKQETDGYPMGCCPTAPTQIEKPWRRAMH